MVYWTEHSSASATRASGAIQQHMMEPKDIGSDTKFITPTPDQRDPGRDGKC